jgi:hypothetical protein
MDDFADLTNPKRICGITGRVVSTPNPTARAERLPNCVSARQSDAIHSP